MKNLSEIIQLPGKDNEIKRVSVTPEFWDEVTNKLRDAHKRYEEEFQPPDDVVMNRSMTE